MALKIPFSLTGKKIWVAGETGLVGSALCRHLRDEDCTLLSAPHSMLDLTRQKDTEDWLQENKPDAIILAAAKVGGIGANSSFPAEFMYENLAIAQNVIHGAYKAGVQKLLFLGSSCIYPKMTPQPMLEDALLSGPLESSNEFYALAKIAGLKMCQAYRKQYGCDFISAMPTNLYGPGDHFDTQNSHVIPALILKIHEAKEAKLPSVELWGTGTPLREFLYVDDLAEALLLLLQKYSDTEPVNIGSGFETSISDLAALIKNIVGYDGEIIFNPKKPDGTPRKFLECSKINKLGWKASTSLEEGLRRTYESFLSSRMDVKPSMARSG